MLSDAFAPRLARVASAEVRTAGSPSLQAHHPGEASGRGTLKLQLALFLLAAGDSDM